MTVVQLPNTVRRLKEQKPKRREKIKQWLQKHRISLMIIAPVLVLIAIASAINFDGFPGRCNDDEGTYAAQAWAVIYRGQLAHYTYWYDHPPVGWLQIAFYAFITNGFHRATTAVTVARELMVIMHVISCGLMYILARRLQFHRAAATTAVLLFTFSPVALYYHHMVFLDNIAVLWVLAALVFAASPKRSLAASFGAALAFVIAVLTKETVVVMIITMVWLMLRHQPKENRGWSFVVYMSSLIAIGLFYPLYAVLKNELTEGPGHVSLIWAMKWQLFEREGTGSVLDSSSVSHATVDWWIQTDPWLLFAGAILVPVAFFMPRLRPIALALCIQLAMLLRSGYLPQPYVIVLIPLSALLIAGVADTLCKKRLLTSVVQQVGGILTKVWFGIRWGFARLGVAFVICAAITFGVLAGPNWVNQFEYSSTYDPSEYSIQATKWVTKNVEKDEVIITDDNIWADLVMDGYNKPIWLYKADLDPAVKKELLPNGYKDVKYLVLPDLSEPLLKSLPIVWDAIQHSEVVQTYGEGNSKMIIRKVMVIE